MKRCWLSALLTAALCLCFLAVGALAAEEAPALDGMAIGYDSKEYCETVEEAAEQMRDGLLARQPVIEILYMQEEGGEISWDQVALRVYEAALEPTEDPRTGDYLADHILKYQVHYSLALVGHTEYITVTFEMTYASTAAQETEVDAAVEDLVKELGLRSSKSDYEKVRAIYDYIADTVTYDDEGKALNDGTAHSCYAALIRHKAVCQGYAGLMYRLLTEAGIPSHIVTGFSEGEDHGWNMVRMDDLYYFLDVTWDAGVPEYRYFLKGTEDFTDHEVDYVGASMGVEEPLDAFPMARVSIFVEGWQTDENGRRYRNEDGTFTADTLRTVGESVYAFDEAGYMVTGWKAVDGAWRWFGEDGKMLTGWLQEGAAWYWLEEDGVMATGWRELDGVRYYFRPSGVMARGWAAADGKWYYLRIDGSMATGWQAADGQWYYFGEDGAMRTGWLQEGSAWYYFRPSGAMASGWQVIDGQWYYFRSSGAMVTGWLMDGGAWYYFRPSGAMASGWQVIDGQWYYFRSSGAMHTGWLKDGDAWYYFRPSGAMASGWQGINGQWYYFQGSGAMLTGWLKDGGSWYWFDENGAMAAGTSLVIDGAVYTFGAGGALRS